MIVFCTYMIFNKVKGIVDQIANKTIKAYGLWLYDQWTVLCRTKQRKSHRWTLSFALFNHLIGFRCFGGCHHFVFSSLLSDSHFAIYSNSQLLYSRLWYIVQFFGPLKRIVIQINGKYVISIKPSMKKKRNTHFVSKWIVARSLKINSRP